MLDNLMRQHLRQQHRVLPTGFMMAGSGALQWRNRHAPCPTDPKLRDACLRTRKVSFAVYLVSVAFYLIGGWFAFVQPWLAE